MSVHLIAVGFNQIPPMESEDLLLYMGFNAQTAGQHVDAQSRGVVLDIGIEGVYVNALQILDSHLHSDDLTLVFTDAYDQTVDGVWTMSPMRKDHLSSVITTITETLGVPLLPGTYESYEAEGVSAIVIKNGGPALHKTMVQLSRAQTRSL